MRAWHLFLGSIIAVFLALLVMISASIALRIQGGIDAAQTRALLALLYRGIYPIIFVALGSLTWHFVRSERGDYA